MARNNRVEEQQNQNGETALRAAVELERIGNAAVHKAQAENRRLGIPNWYSINGRIVSDQEISASKERE